MKILLQTTIPFAEDDWHVGRFSLLRAELSKTADVTARDRENGGDGNDPVLMNLPDSDFDQLWLIAVDTGDGLTTAECDAISRFRESGGGLFLTRDHMDLGSSLCNLAGVGKAHFFHTKNLDPDETRHANDDSVTTTIGWPNYYSGPNGDVQPLEVPLPVHPVLAGVKTLPAHPHEGAVGAPAGVDEARVVALGKSKQTGRVFNIAVAFEGGNGIGKGWAESTFHHFVDYNWDTSLGCPSFVSEAASNAIARNPQLIDDTKRYVANLATWMGSRAGRV